MKLKTVTLLAAILQLINLLFWIAVYIRNCIKLDLSYNWDYVLTQPINILAAAALTLFLFTFYSRQNE